MHKVMENIAERLSETHPLPAMADPGKEQGESERSPWGSWKPVDPEGGLPTTQTTSTEEVRAPQLEDPDSNRGQGEFVANYSIRETQALTSNHGEHVEATSSAEEDLEGDWAEYHNTSPGNYSPPGGQRCIGDEEDLVDLGTGAMDSMTEET